MATEQQVYELVQSGQMTKTEFLDWVTKQVGAAWSEGYEEGHVEGYSTGFDCGRND